MTFPLPAITVNPDGQTAVVELTRDAGTPVSAFSDSEGQSAISLPATISTTTSFYVEGDGDVTVAVSVNGLQVVSRTIDLENQDDTTVGIQANSGDAIQDRLFANEAGEGPLVTKFATTIGDGSSLSYTVTHNLGTSDVQVTVIDLTTTQVVFPTVSVVNTSEVSVAFSVAPASNSIRVVVGGF